MSAAVKYIPNYKIRDYKRWEGDWELWDGIPVALDPGRTAKHQRVVGKLLLQFDSAIAASGAQDCEAISRIDWQISDNTIVRPDFLIVCHPLPSIRLLSTPPLIAEVLSPTTAKKDRTAKKSLYESAKVPYYLLFDPKKERIQAWNLADDHYESLELTPITQLRINEHCKITVDLQAVFK